MKKTRFTEEQIVGALKQAEAGMKVSEVCRQTGVSQHTFYYWRRKYGGLEVNEAKRLRELADLRRHAGQDFEAKIFFVPESLFGRQNTGGVCKRMAGMLSTQNRIF